MEKGKTGLRSAVVSVHDVMPETLPQVCGIVRFLETEGVNRLTLLVVPGKGWSVDQIEQLRALQDGGIDLAGHGWRHRAFRKETLFHRLHGVVVSRDEAEHLSLCEAEIARIVTRCYAWFDTAGLVSPVLYVPPAWALGKLSQRCRKGLPFRFYETQLGIYDRDISRHMKLPVTGYMADTPFRRGVLRAVNALSMAAPWAPVRIAIHPGDVKLPLFSDLRRHLGRCRRFLRYHDLGGSENVSPSTGRVNRPGDRLPTRVLS